MGTTDTNEDEHSTPVQLEHYLGGISTVFTASIHSKPTKYCSEKEYHSRLETVAERGRGHDSEVDKEVDQHFLKFQGPWLLR